MAAGALTLNMAGGLINILPIWAVFILTVLLVLAAHEIGFRWASYKKKKSRLEGEGPVGTIVGATLGLLALLLGFTFGVAAERFEARRMTLLEEANAIGTAFRRAELLEEPNRKQVRSLLRSYVDERLQWAAGQTVQPQRSATELHKQLWAQTVDAGVKHPNSQTVSLFIESVNHVIDLHTREIMVHKMSRIPRVIWIILYLVALLALGVMGYHSGVAGTTRSPAMLAVALAFSAVIALIVDLDRPTEGVIRTSQQLMIDLRDWMAQAGP